MSVKPDPRFGAVPLGSNATPGDGEPDSSGPLSAGVPLAKLIKRTLLAQPEIVMLSAPRGLGAERFRRLRTILVNQERDQAQVIVVTSGAPEEGKSTVAVNLALAFAADGDESTLLLDADLRRPTIGSWLRPSPQLGLAELLAGRTSAEHTILTLTNTPLHVLPAGGSVGNPMDLLSSDIAKSTIAKLRERYRRIIIDTAPIVPFTDADVIGSQSDGLLMVTRSGETPTSIYQQAIQAVTSTRILGAVLNGATGSLADSKEYYDKYYDRYSRRDRNA